MFDLIGGLPIHPLVVHFAVVLLPLSALGLILVVAVPRLRGKVQTILIMLGLIAGTAAAYVAKESGEALAERVGLPVQHADYGDMTVIVGGLLAVVAAVWFFLVHKGYGKAAVISVGGVAVALSVASMVVVTLAGHTGAEAAWGPKMAALTAAESPAPAPATTTTPAAADSPYTAQAVAQHATASDCWSIVDGNVYDLTQWIPQHPGGPQVVEAMCGKDGSAGFNGEHAGQGEPADVLAGFLLGPVGTAPAATASPQPTASPSSGSVATGYTAQDVAAHASAADCWSIVDGNVYDLTQWIPQHPGGPQVVEAMCGKDGSAGFNGQHGNQGKPEKVLAGYLLGPVA